MWKPSQPRVRTMLGLMFVAATMIGLVACASLKRVQYSYQSDYDFTGKTVGLIVVLDGKEQTALDDNRVARRALENESGDGYVGAVPDIQPDLGAVSDIGTIIPPPDVESLNDKMEHSTFYDEHLVGPVSEATQEILERHGYTVRVIPAPLGEFRLSEIAERAAKEGCDLLAVESLAIARSWNIHSGYSSGTARSVSSSLRWKLQTGGLTVINMTVFDIASGGVVWQHDRREVEGAMLGPLLGELYDDRLAQGEYAHESDAYQAYLYRQSAYRALNLLFASSDEEFTPLPFASDSLKQIRLIQRYDVDEDVYVRPVPEARVWHLAKVVSSTDTEVEVQWLEGMWPEYAKRTRFGKLDIIRANAWPPIIWVRHKTDLEYSPFRLSRYNNRTGFVYTRLAGDVEEKTWLVGRVGIIPTTAGIDN